MLAGHGQEAHRGGPGPAGDGLAPLARELLEEIGLTPLHLFAGEVFLVRGEGPPVSERIDDAPAPIAPELIADGHGHLAAGRHRPIEQGVAVLDVDPKGGRRAAQGFGAFRAHHRVVEHHARITDPDLRVHELSVRPRAAAQLLGAERLLVPIDRRRALVEGERRRDRVKTLGNRLLRLGHDRLLGRRLYTRTPHPRSTYSNAMPMRPGAVISTSPDSAND